MRLSLGRKAYGQGYHHGNRLGWVGYGIKPSANVAAPATNTAFRNITLKEIPAWLMARQRDPVYLFFSVKRYFVAWIFKYARPGIIPVGGQMVGQHGLPHNFIPSGTLIAQFILVFGFICNQFLSRDEVHHHKHTKYDRYPLSETVMHYLPWKYTEGDVGGKVAWMSLAFDVLIFGAIIQFTASHKGIRSLTPAKASAEPGLLILAVALLLSDVIIHTVKGDRGTDVVGRNDLAELLGCSEKEHREVLDHEGKIKSNLRNSLFFNSVMRLWDAIPGLSDLPIEVSK